MSGSASRSRRHPRHVVHHHSIMVLHDARLKGTLPAIRGYSLQADKNSSVASCIHRLASWAKLGAGVLKPKSGHKTSLLIVAHGMENHTSNDTRMSTLKGTLGYGLLIGSERLTLNNLSLMKQLYGLLDWIVLYACGPANTAAGNEGTLGDGIRFCTEMACYTGANVIASGSTQYYQHNGPIHFTHWRPPLYEYKPDGSRVSL